MFQARYILISSLGVSTGFVFPSQDQLIGYTDTMFFLYLLSNLPLKTLSWGHCEILFDTRQRSHQSPETLCYNFVFQVIGRQWQKQLYFTTLDFGNTSLELRKLTLTFYPE
jgi:hypothetical protein